jgi:hypothetical protein
LFVTDTCGGEQVPGYRRFHERMTAPWRGGQSAARRVRAGFLIADICG